MSDDVWKTPPVAYCDDEGRRYGTGPELVARVKMLRAIVDHLPTTKDGHPIYPGAELWCDTGVMIERVNILSVSGVAAAFAPVDGPDRNRGDLSAPADWFFSTREAAIDERNAEHMPTYP